MHVSLTIFDIVDTPVLKEKANERNELPVERYLEKKESIINNRITVILYKYNMRKGIEKRRSKLYLQFSLSHSSFY